MKPLTREDKQNAFVSATTSYTEAHKRWAERATSGMTDDALIEALKYELGIAGGSSGHRDCPCIHYQGAGLKVWARWESFIPQQTEPIYKGKATVQMAREIYGIKEPSDMQLALF